jgi:hypothetical protein
MSDIAEYKCTGCKLSTWSMFDLSGRPHIECPQGDGLWESVIENETYLTARISPNCSPETLQALGEMVNVLITQIENGNISIGNSPRPRPVAVLGAHCKDCGGVVFHTSDCPSREAQRK